MVVVVVAVAVAEVEVVSSSRGSKPLCSQPRAASARTMDSEETV